MAGKDDDFQRGEVLYELADLFEAQDGDDYFDTAVRFPDTFKATLDTLIDQA